jgi:hypothetical protein
MISFPRGRRLAVAAVLLRCAISVRPEVRHIERRHAKSLAVFRDLFGERVNP